MRNSVYTTRTRWLLPSITWVAIVFFGCVPSFGAANFWSGNWKLDEAKSSPQGPSYAMTVTPQGEYKITNTAYSYSFRCDGKDYPTIGEDSVVCLHGDATTMDMVSKRSGKALASRHLELSKDGASITSHITLIHPDGSKQLKTRVYFRASASTGLEGSWKDADRSDSDPARMVTTLTGSTFRVAFPDVKQVTNMNLDGADAPIKGLSSGSKVTLSVKLESPVKMATAQKIDGVLVKQGTLLMSSDGKTLIQETWRPGSPSVRSRLVFDRQ